MKRIKNQIEQIIKYFSNFNYVPTVDEIHQFFPQTISKDTLGEYCIRMKNLEFRIKNFEQERRKRKLISEQKINKIKTYIHILKKFPQIKLIGLSGTVAMNNAQENDDIDLFIITAANRLWTGRLIVTLLAIVMGLKRKRHKTNSVPHVPCHKNRVCLNLFFDESDLQVPKYKQTGYVGHEVLQMKPLINKDQIYEWFLKANEWVLGMFSNALENSKVKIQKSKIQVKSQNFLFFNLIIHLLAAGFELITKYLQLVLINRHRTTEIVTDTQLWFFPDDYEKKIR